MPNNGFHSLEDFLISTHLSIDAVLDDGGGAAMPVKGREIQAVVLFADMTSFSARTLEMSPAETLIFVQWFFAWIGAEALRHGNGIIDKYIGDEVMIVFSKEFGSEDPLVEAIQTARWMAEHDPWSFCPHIGIASGFVIVGYVGTPLKFNCSVFGRPVALAARLAGEKPEYDGAYSSSIVLPASDWADRNFDEIFPPQRYRDPDGTEFEQPHPWQLLPAREVSPKNIPAVAIREIIKTSINLSSTPVEEATRQVLDLIRQSGRYWTSPEA